VVALPRGGGARVGPPPAAGVGIGDNDAPPAVVPPKDCGCGGGGELPRQPAGLPSAPGRGFSEGPVRYFDGTVKVASTDLSSSGFGTPWGQDRSWTNAPAASGSDGSGTVVSQRPYLVKDNANVVALGTNGTTARYFDPGGATNGPRSSPQEPLTYTPGAGEYPLTDEAGNRLKFYDFNASLPAAQRGQLKSFTDPDGNTTSTTSWNGDGKPTEVQR